MINDKYQTKKKSINVMAIHHHYYYIFFTISHHGKTNIIATLKNTLKENENKDYLIIFTGRTENEK